ncbi:MAG: RecQ family ATP-dependent DNA helicase [Crocinitomicaceae bacterium]|nr:RecQ family ATP-dependent DNA helicase [Crocinitomicaceae bacterium]
MTKYWGYSAFREKQKEIIDSVLSGRDTLALLPTGGGKSICYQVPALAKPGLTLVISPLIALMHDQVENLKSKGIKAIAITSGMSAKQIDILLDNAVYGETKLLYVSPERLKTHLFQVRFQKMNINLTAVDEAHCISQWGYDFRPAYLDIAELRKIKPNVPVMALTATATTQVVKDIQDKLNFVQGAVIQKSFFRSNLIYSTYLTTNKKNRAEEFLRQNSGTGIIYCATRKSVKELASHLIQKKIAADFYHAGLDFETRKTKQQDWMEERTRIIVSTNAFGMGIDKPNVRFVIHYDIPDTIEAYFQEAGRAGRDEKEAKAVLFFEKKDINQLVEKTNTRYPSLDKIKAIYNALGNHLQVAFGAGKEERYPIDINDFCNKYNFQLMETYNALRFLELTGYIQLTESAYTPAKLKINATSIQLYQEQVKDKNMNTVIQFILRTNMGIFEDYSNINEFIIAQKTGLTKQIVIEKIKLLHKLELADYIPQTDQPQITFLTERLPETHLEISPRFYHERKEIAFEKMKSIVQFLESDECRSVLLLKYFGESDGQNCGQCSACLEKKKQENLSNLDKSVFHKIKQQLYQNSEVSVSFVLDHFSDVSREDILQILRALADHSLIRISDDGQHIFVT